MQTKEKLAVQGGPRAVPYEIPLYRSFGQEEVEAAKRVVESGVLSKFLGCWADDFYGGPKIREFEAAWKAYFKVGHAVAVNSCTSGLIAAVGAIGVEPGDEVIVSPWTMCATATAILIWNAIPIFADIEADTFCLDPASIEKCITPRTKAIVVTDIFGHGARLNEILKIAKKFNLKVIEDAAQAPAALYHGKHVGTIADIGVYSLNYHKHIHTGEGGVCVTNDDRLAERMQLIRNHAEAVVEGKEVTDLCNLLGFNFRLGEIEAAMGTEQLKKLDRLAESRTVGGQQLTDGLRGLKGLKTPVVEPDCTHVYYIYPLILDPSQVRAPREKIVAALRAEGVPGLKDGYANLHRYPLYQRKIAYGTKGYPWTSPEYKGNANYSKGICPVAEELNDQTFLGIILCSYRFNAEDIGYVVKAFRKVWDNLDNL